MAYTNFKKLASELYRNNDYNFELKLNNTYIYEASGNKILIMNMQFSLALSNYIN